MFKFTSGRKLPAGFNQKKNKADEEQVERDELTKIIFFTYPGCVC